MGAGIWNIRGYRQRRTQVLELMQKEHLDFVGLQENMMTSFTTADLLGVDPRGKFAWHFTPAPGRSGGMILGVNEDTFEVLEWISGQFFIRVDVQQLDNLKKWSFIVVYGPADHCRALEFLGGALTGSGGVPLPSCGWRRL
jgi:exonuclease III